MKNTLAHTFEKLRLKLRTYQKDGLVSLLIWTWTQILLLHIYCDVCKAFLFTSYIARSCDALKRLEKIHLFIYHCWFVLVLFRCKVVSQFNILPHIWQIIEIRQMRMHLGKYRSNKSPTLPNKSNQNGLSNSK